MLEYKLTKKEAGPMTFNMALSSFRIVFMGTPEFAVASLDALFRSGYTIAGVITAPDKPAGRGMKITQSAVKKYALEHGLKVLQPEKLKDPSFLEELKALHADMQVVVAFRMLPELVWNMPPKGTINLHGSLLPQYRGAAPINWAVINGERETGVTAFKLKQEIDTGDILLQESFLIGDNETAGEVHDRMKDIGAGLVVKTVQGIMEGTLKEVPQSELSHSPLTTTHSPLKPAPKIHTDTCRIDWGQPVEKIFDLVRGLSPYPGAFTMMNEKMLKIYKAEKEIITPKSSPGGYETDSKTFLKFASINGYLNVKEIQMEGKKKMGVEEFLRGFRMS